MPKSTRYIEIMDTTLRDGEQTSGVSFSASEKLTIAQILLTEVKVERPSQFQVDAATSVPFCRINSGRMRTIRFGLPAVCSSTSFT